MWDPLLESDEILTDWISSCPLWIQSEEVIKLMKQVLEINENLTDFENNILIKKNNWELFLDFQWEKYKIISFDLWIKKIILETIDLKIKFFDLINKTFLLEWKEFDWIDVENTSIKAEWVYIVNDSWVKRIVKLDDNMIAQNIDEKILREWKIDITKSFRTKGAWKILIPIYYDGFVYFFNISDDNLLNSTVWEKSNIEKPILDLRWYIYIVLEVNEWLYSVKNIISWENIDWEYSFIDPELFLVKNWYYVLSAKDSNWQSWLLNLSDWSFTTLDWLEIDMNNNTYSHSEKPEWLLRLIKSPKKKSKLIF